MKNIKYNHPVVFYITLSIILVFIGCSRDEEELELATYPTNSDIFIDGFSGGLEYMPFAGSKLNAFTVDTETKYEGSAAMRFDVPNEGDQEGSYAGAIFPDNFGRDLSSYDALTFWAKGSQAGTINEIGYGNNFGENKYLASVKNLQLSTNWKKYTIPFPDASKLTQERGMFWYSEGPEEGKGYSFWIDALQFETLGTISLARPSILGGENLESQSFNGAEIPISSLGATFNLISGEELFVCAAPSYFEFTSSNSAAATVNELGIINVIGAGSTSVTATLNGNTATGSIALNSVGQFQSAPIPTQSEADVISIFSDAYTSQPVDYYNGFWQFSSTLGGADFEINGDNLIVYTDLNFVGIQFATDVPPIDISEMTHFHVDLLITDELEASDFLRIGLNDIGPDNSFGGGDDSGQELSFSTPVLKSGEWVSLDIPLSDFTGLSGLRNLAQVVFVSDLTIPNITIDNIYFYKDGMINSGGDTEPNTAAPLPTQDASSVISLFSDIYMDVNVDTWRTDWSSAILEDISVVGDPTKKYSNLDFVGIETTSTPVDASQMTHLHLDIWSADLTQFGIKIVDFGPNGAFDGGDDTEHQIDIIDLQQGEWVSLDIPLSDFEGLTTRASIAQYILVGQPSGMTSIFIDNFFFYSENFGGATAPTSAAPIPEQNAVNVISLFSDAYNDVTLDTWRTDWSVADFEDVTIDENPTKKYSNLDFVGIETVSNTVDASEMSHIHMDIWSPDFTVFGIKIVDFGVDGGFGGDDDSEHQINLENLNQGEWVSLDLSLDDFTGLTNRTNIAQYILVGQPTGMTTVFIDNFYFYGVGTGNSTEPTVAAPSPTDDPGDVISLFSDSYTDVTVDTWRTDWSSSTFEDIVIDGNATKKYSELDFVGIETVSTTIDATDMTHFKIDVWSADFTLFGIKIVDFGPDGAFGGDDDAEHQINIEMPEKESWVTLDIPLSDFEGLLSKGSIAQLILVAQPAGTSTIFADNIYFHK